METGILIVVDELPGRNVSTTSVESGINIPELISVHRSPCYKERRIEKGFSR